MGKNVIRMAGATVCAGAMVAGAIVGAGGASAATPGDLEVKTFVECVDGKTVRLIYVENVGETPITGVRVGSVLGPEVRVKSNMERNFPDGPDEEVNGVPIATGTGTGPNNSLGKGQNFMIGQVTPGCGGPYAVVGYAIGNEIDNVFDKPNYAIDFDLVGPVAKYFAG